MILGPSCTRHKQHGDETATRSNPTNLPLLPLIFRLRNISLTRYNGLLDLLFRFDQVNQGVARKIDFAARECSWPITVLIW